MAWALTAKGPRQRRSDPAMAQPSKVRLRLTGASCRTILHRTPQQLITSTPLI
jgi:hypothetical protein